MVRRLVGVGVVLALVVAALVVVLVLRGDLHDDVPPPRQLADPEPPRQALAETLAGLDHRYFLSARLEPSQARHRRPMTLDTELIRGAGPLDVVRATWESQLLASDVAERMTGGHGPLRDQIDDCHASFVPSAGHASHGATCQMSEPSPPASQEVTASSTVDDQIKAEVTADATQLGFDVQQVDVLHPLGHAVALTLTVPRPEVLRKLSDLELRIEARQQPRALEGLFIGVLSNDTTSIIAATQYVSNAAEGGTLFADAYQKYDPFNHG